MAAEHVTADTGQDRSIMLEPAAGVHVKVHRDSYQRFSHGVAFGRNFLECASAIRKSPEVTAVFFRCVGYLNNCIEALTGTVTFLGNLNVRILGAADFIDAFGFLKSIHDITSAPSSDDDRVTQIIKHLANVVFTGVTGSCALLLMESLKFIELAKIAESIGNTIPVLKFVSNMSCVIFLRGLLGVGYTIVGVEAFLRLDRALNEEQKHKAMIDIAHATAQIALQLTFIAGASITFPVAVLGAVAYGLGIMSFLYEYYNREALKQKEVVSEPVNIELQPIIA